MATGQRYFPPVSFAVDTNGVPLALAQLYFYVTGTDTLLATYSDVNLTVPNTNPVIADSSGQWPSIFMSTAQYKVRLFDSSDNEIWTRDPVFVSVQSSTEQFASGVRLLFPQAAAPTGWTQVLTINDRVLRVVSAAGGGIGGSWTISGLTGTVGSHTLTLNEIPSHSHVIYDNASGTTTGGGTDFVAPVGSTIGTGNSGGGAGHDHSFSGVFDGTWRPSYLNTIFASKD